MYFHPSDNLFGAPLAVWLGVALIWLGPFAFFRWIAPWQNRRDEARLRDAQRPPDEPRGEG